MNLVLLIVLVILILFALLYVLHGYFVREEPISGLQSPSPVVVEAPSQSNPKSKVPKNRPDPSSWIVMFVIALDDEKLEKNRPSNPLDSYSNAIERAGGEIVDFDSHLGIYDDRDRTPFNTITYRVKFGTSDRDKIKKPISDIYSAIKNNTYTKDASFFMNEPPTPSPVRDDAMAWHAMYTIEFTDHASYSPPVADIFEIIERFNGQVVEREIRSGNVGDLAVAVIESMNIYVHFNNATTRSKDIKYVWNELKSAVYAKNVLMILNDEGTSVPRPSPLCDNAGLVCPAVWNPVCGVDQKTYSNACYAARECVEVARKGQC
jgi:hypothetical protein